MSRWRLFYHVVWATKDREQVITAEREACVHHQIRAAAERQQIVVHAVGGIADHVHLAMSIPPTLAIATALQGIKGASSHAINQEFDGVFRWQPDYNIDSFSARHLDRVIAYINNQHRHHAEGTLWGSIVLSTGDR